MTDDTTRRLEEIEERFRRGTEGLDEEWVVSDSEVVSVTLNSDIMAAVCEVGPEDEEGVMERAALFANVRTDIPWLLSQVRSLRSQLEEAERERKWMQGVVNAARAVVDSTRRFEIRAKNKPRQVHHHVGLDEYVELLRALTAGLTDDTPAAPPQSGDEV